MDMAGPMSDGTGWFRETTETSWAAALAPAGQVGQTRLVAETTPPPILIVSGPPGAGKTTVARKLAESSHRPAVHLHTDDFYNAIRSGFIAPWLPESSRQNATISRAIAAAAIEYALGGYAVVIDGVVGPWFLDVYRQAAARAGVPLAYVVLRPDRPTVTARARDRETGPLADYPPRIFEGFADLGALEPHAIDTTRWSIAETVARVQAGGFELAHR
jgi:predicted kinase